MKNLMAPSQSSVARCGLIITRTSPNGTIHSCATRLRWTYRQSQEELHTLVIVIVIVTSSSIAIIIIATIINPCCALIKLRITIDTNSIKYTMPYNSHQAIVIIFVYQESYHN